jgi:hypothetical protein
VFADFLGGRARQRVLPENGRGDEHDAETGSFRNLFPGQLLLRLGGDRRLGKLHARILVRLGL